MWIASGGCLFNAYMHLLQSIGMGHMCFNVLWVVCWEFSELLGSSYAYHSGPGDHEGLGHQAYVCEEGESASSDQGGEPGSHPEECEEGECPSSCL